MRNGFYCRACLGAILVIFPAVAHAQSVAESTVGALRLPVMRAAQTAREAADQHWQSNRKYDAVRLWQSVLTDTDPQYLSGPGALQTGSAALSDWLRSGPRERWELWNDAVSPAAERAWQRWQVTQRDDDLRSLCRQYGLSRLGLMAWSTLAQRLRDTHRLELATACLAQILEHPAATQNDRAQAALELIVLQVHRREWEQAARWKQRTAMQLVGQTVRSRGITRPAAEVLSEVWQAVPTEHPETPRDLPATVAEWTVDAPLPEDLRLYWADILRDYQAEGALIAPIAEPLVVRDILYWRTLAATLAVRTTDGSIVWRQARDTFPAVTGKSLENREYRQTALDQTVRRVVADSVTGRLSADDARLYAIELGQRAPRNVLTSPPPNAEEVPPTNRLVAYDQQTGQIVWSAGGVAAGPTYSFAEMYFCGPPLAIESTLYVVAQQRDTLKLLALQSETGELLWQLELGGTPRPLQVDPARQRVAATLHAQDGRLYCATGHGALIVVDPVLRVPVWAFRYPVLTHDQTARNGRESTAFLPDPWWNAWRETALFTTEDGTLILASPESSMLFALDARSGQLRWQRPRDRGLWVLAADSQRVLIGESDAVRAHATATGDKLWRTRTGELAGRGVLQDAVLVLPLQTGEIVELSLRDGREQFRTPAGSLTPSRLTRTAAGWFAHDGERCLKLPERIAALTAALARWQHDPLVRVHREAALRLAVETNALDQAASILAARGPDTLVDSEARRRTLSRTPERWSELLQPVHAGVSHQERLADIAIAARLALARGETAVVADALLEQVSRASSSEFIALGVPQRLVRADRAWIGLWTDLLREAPPSERAVLEVRFHAYWQAARQGTDPFAWPRLIELWHPSPAVRVALLSDEPQRFLGRSVRSIELQSLSAVAEPFPERGAMLAQWTRWLQGEGFARESRVYAERGWRIDPGGFGSTLRAAQDNMQTAPAVPRDPWPWTVPLADAVNERNEHIYQLPVPLDVATGDLFERLDVSIDRVGRRVRFASRDHRGFWEVALPPAPNSLRASSQLLAGWGRGSLLMLRAGSELFAIAPFDDRGEPAARLLYAIDLTGGSIILPDQVRLEPVPGLLGIREDDVRVVTGFGRTLAAVGPVRNSYFCAIEKGHLIAYETLTGRKRWQRSALPIDAQVFGDETLVVLWSPARRELDVLRSLDGAPVSTRTWDAAPEQLLTVLDTHAFVIEAEPTGVGLRCEDLTTGSVRWQSRWSAGATPFLLDQFTLGIVEPRGLLHVVSSADGSPVGEPLTVVVPQPLGKVVVARDAERWYVGLSGKFDLAAALQNAQMRQSYRMPTVDGPLFALDRQTGLIEWSQRLERTPWILDQSRTAPLLVQAYKLPPSDFTNSRSTDGIVRLFDKRTGAVVFTKQDPNLIAWVSLLADADRSVVEVRLERETIRLRYAPQPPPPAMPVEETKGSGR